MREPATAITLGGGRGMVGVGLGGMTSTGSTGQGRVTGSTYTRGKVEDTRSVIGAGGGRHDEPEGFSYPS